MLDIKMNFYIDIKLKFFNIIKKHRHKKKYIITFKNWDYYIIISFSCKEKKICLKKLKKINKNKIKIKLLKNTCNIFVKQKC